MALVFLTLLLSSRVLAIDPRVVSFPQERDVEPAPPSILPRGKSGCPEIGTGNRGSTAGVVRASIDCAKIAADLIVELLQWSARRVSFHQQAR